MRHYGPQGRSRSTGEDLPSRDAPFVSKTCNHAEHTPHIRGRADDGLDGEIFVFKNLAAGVHTTSTQIVLLLFRIRSFPFLRQTGRTPSTKSDDPICFNGGMNRASAPVFARLPQRDSMCIAPSQG
jgi:hypothetical protein